MSLVFFALGAAMAAFGLINAAAVAGGAWFDRPATAERVPLLLWRRTSE